MPASRASRAHHTPERVDNSGPDVPVHLFEGTRAEQDRPTDHAVYRKSNALLPMTIVAGVPPFHSRGTHADRQASGAGGSGSAAAAVRRRLHAFVRRGFWHRHWAYLPLLAESHKGT